MFYPQLRASVDGFACVEPVFLVDISAVMLILISEHVLVKIGPKRYLTGESL